MLGLENEPNVIQISEKYLSRQERVATLSTIQTKQLLSVIDSYQKELFAWNALYKTFGFGRKCELDLHLITPRRI